MPTNQPTKFIFPFPLFFPQLSLPLSLISLLIRLAAMKRFSTIVAGRQRCSAVAAYGREWLGGISLGDYNDGWLRGAALEQIWHSSEHQQSGSATIRPWKHHFRFHQASGATVPPLADHTLPRRVHPPSLTVETRFRQ